MKLATLNNGKRDGALVVVSRDLARAVYNRLLQEHPRADRSAPSLLRHLRLLEELGLSDDGLP